MKRSSKKHGSKKAFTLVEMLIVIFIIVILASVLGVGATKLINTARAADSAVAESSRINSLQRFNSETLLAHYNFG